MTRTSLQIIKKIHVFKKGDTQIGLCQNFRFPLEKEDVIR